MVPFCKLIPQMGSFLNNFCHGVVFYVVCMQNACKTQAPLATSWALDTWKPNPPVLLATSGGSASRQFCWRLQACAEIAALIGNFQGYQARVQDAQKPFPRELQSKESPVWLTILLRSLNRQQHLRFAFVKSPPSPVDHHAKKRQKERECCCCSCVLEHPAGKKKEARGTWVLLLFMCLRASSRKEKRS